MERLALAGRLDGALHARVRGRHRHYGWPGLLTHLVRGGMRRAGRQVCRLCGRRLWPSDGHGGRRSRRRRRLVVAGTLRRGRRGRRRL
jgi:hypothetical protein